MFAGALRHLFPAPHEGSQLDVRAPVFYFGGFLDSRHPSARKPDTCGQEALRSMIDKVLIPTALLALMGGIADSKSLANHELHVSAENHREVKKGT